jgi:hypothetical protein
VSRFSLAALHTQSSVLKSCVAFSHLRQPLLAVALMVSLISLFLFHCVWRDYVIYTIPMQQENDIKFWGKRRLVCVAIPYDLHDAAKDLKLNVSAECSKHLRRVVRRKMKGAK